MHGNALLKAVVGAAAIVVVSGSLACIPKDTFTGTTLGVPLSSEVEWIEQALSNQTWMDYLQDW